MNTKTIGLIGTIVKVIIAVAGAIFCILIMTNSGDIEDVTVGKEMRERAIGFIDSGLTISYIAMILCVGAVLIFGLYYFITNIGKSKGMLFALIGFAIVLGISYGMADGNLTLNWQNAGVTEQVSKLTSAGLYATFILLGLAIAMVLVSEVSKIFK